MSNTVILGDTIMVILPPKKHDHRPGYLCLMPHLPKEEPTHE